MITITGTNSKKIKDPVFLSARKFMVDRIAKLEAAGPSKELALEKERYTGLQHEDVMIEPPVKFTGGTVLCCFLSRKTGFFRADIEVEIVPLDPILAEFSVNFVTYPTIADLVTAVKDGTQIAGVVFITALKKFGIITSAAYATPDDVMKAFGDIYWDEITSESLPSMDPTNKNSGVFGLKAINIKPEAGLLFFVEDIKAIK